MTRPDTGPRQGCVSSVSGRLDFRQSGQTVSFFVPIVRICFRLTRRSPTRSRRARTPSRSTGSSGCSARRPVQPRSATTHHSFRDSFSAVSTPILATKYAFCNIFQNLQNCLIEISKHCRKLKNQRFSQNISNILGKMENLANFNICKKLRFLQNFKFAKF